MAIAQAGATAAATAGDVSPMGSDTVSEDSSSSSSSEDSDDSNDGLLDRPADSDSRGRGRLCVRRIANSGNDRQSDRLAGNDRLSNRLSNMWYPDRL